LINAQEFKDSIVSGANNIFRHQIHINDLNIFPVPDGDTGTNMCMTILGVAERLNKIEKNSKIGEIAKIVSSYALRYARGNSGVILSLILKGFSEILENIEVADTCDIIKGLEKGVLNAYNAVVTPTEGTMLTVARVASERGRAAFNENFELVKVWEELSKGARDALKETPNLLPVLKKAGVVDAGGKGLCLLFEGMLSVIRDKKIISREIEIMNLEKNDVINVDNYFLDIKFIYCTEFVIEKCTACDFEQIKFKKSLEKVGDSVVVVDDEEIIKVHVHTNYPDKVLNKALYFGKLTTVKIENMEEQQKALVQYRIEKECSYDNTSEESSLPIKKFGIIAVASGNGLINLFKNLGCDKVIKGGQTMNPSSEYIAQVAMSVHAETIFILPNNKNIFMAAEQSSKFVKDKNLIVIPTKTIPQGISAALAFDQNISCEQNSNNMIDCIKKVNTGHITYAARDSEFGGFRIKKGDIIALKDGKLKIVENDPIEAAKKLLKLMIKKETRFVTIIYGKDITEEKALILQLDINKKFKNIDTPIIEGGGDLYYFIISVE